MLEFNSENFEQEVIQSELPVVVDFWATWCQPCLKLAPTLEELSGEYEGKVKFGKLNVENEQALAAKYGVLSIPTLLFFKNGEIANQTVGLLPKKKLEQALEKVL